MNVITYISLGLGTALIIMAIAYFQAACKLSVAEKWLIDFKDLRDWRKNIALTRRIMRAIVRRERVSSPHYLQQVRIRFYLLLMVASATVVWIIGLCLR